MSKQVTPRMGTMVYSTLRLLTAEATVQEAVESRVHAGRCKAPSGRRITLLRNTLRPLAPTKRENAILSAVTTLATRAQNRQNFVPYNVYEMSGKIL